MSHILFLRLYEVPINIWVNLKLIFYKPITNIYKIRIYVATSSSQSYHPKERKVEVTAGLQRSLLIDDDSCMHAPF